MIVVDLCAWNVIQVRWGALRSVRVPDILNNTIEVIEIALHQPVGYSVWGDGIHLFRSSRILHSKKKCHGMGRHDFIFATKSISKSYKFNVTCIKLHRFGWYAFWGSCSYAILSYFDVLQKMMSVKNRMHVKYTPDDYETITCFCMCLICDCTGEIIYPVVKETRHSNGSMRIWHLNYNLHILCKVSSDMWEEYGQWFSDPVHFKWLRVTKVVCVRFETPMNRSQRTHYAIMTQW